MGSPTRARCSSHPGWRQWARGRSRDRAGRSSPAGDPRPAPSDGVHRARTPALGARGRRRPGTRSRRRRTHPGRPRRPAGRAGRREPPPEPFLAEPFVAEASPAPLVGADAIADRLHEVVAGASPGGGGTGRTELRFDHHHRRHHPARLDDHRPGRSDDHRASRPDGGRPDGGRTGGAGHARRGRRWWTRRRDPPGDHARRRRCGGRRGGRGRRARGGGRRRRRAARRARAGRGPGDQRFAAHEPVGARSGAVRATPGR